MVFEKTLTDIVKGIRASKRDTALYISSCIAEIKSEINSTDPNTKSNALQKLTFLQMMGYNMSWASFATIEVMSSTRFAHKRIGYLAATQAFTQDTDVILLTTNTLKKELRGAVGPGMNGVYEAGLAINCLSNIVTEDLARELLGDVTNLTVHPQPYLRKKAILCLFKMFMKYPQALRLTFPKLQECLLKDKNPSVTSCAVNVITELSDVNPKNYLVLAPSFFALLTNGSNNWTLIKVVKLLGALVPEEPRLARKLLDPLAQIVNSTQAKSLLYEAVYTITLCLPYCRKADGSMPPNVPDIIALSAETLRSFVEEADQNLKYLGLMGFSSLMMSHPKVLSAPGYRPLILTCLSDDDVTIRTRALDLLIGLATRKNLMDLVTQLLHHVDMASGVYKIDLVEKIIEICSSEKYALVTDFAWYIDVLVIFARTKGIDGHGKSGRNLGPLISNQVIDVTLRVLPVRSYAVRRMIGLLLDGGKNNETGIFSGGTFGVETNVSMMPEVLPVAAFIIGEYSTLVDEAVSMEIEGGDDEDELLHYNSTSKGTYHAVIQKLTDPSNIDSMSLRTQSIYAQGTMKIFAAAACSKKCPDGELEACSNTLAKYLPVYMQSTDTEVQERAFTAFHLLKSLDLVKNAFTPGLEKIDKNDGSDSDEESTSAKGNAISNITDDLLNLGMESDAPKLPTNTNPTFFSTATGSKSGTIAAKIRRASTTLKYLFIPEHMKPVSGKAQRKKISSAPNHVTSILEKGHMSVFSRLLNEEKARGVQSVESVSFTQQKPVKVTKSVTSMSNSMVATRPSNDGFLAGMMSNNTTQNECTNTTTSLNGTKQQDPFYLNSNTKGESADSKSQNRFGTIQLVDSDGNESNNGKKKKRKKKTKKQAKRNESADLEFLAGMGAATALNEEVPNVQHSIMDSDDGEDNEPALTMVRRVDKNQTSASNMNSLAGIDLTMPLRADEYIPAPKHHVVPERHISELGSNELPRSAKKKKKDKKSKSSKEKKASKISVRNASTTSDLLDFGGFGITDNSGVSPSEAPQVNPINGAFDDLLSLDAPAPLPVLALPSSMPLETVAGFSENQIDKSSKVFRIWQKAAIKGSISFDCNNIKVTYRTHSPKKDSVKISLRVQNKSDTDVLQNVSIYLPGIDSLMLSNIAPRAEIDAGKIGPFSMSSMDVKGKIEVGGESAIIKILLPSSLALSPLQLQQDQVASMLSSGNWESYSSKLDFHEEFDDYKLKTSLVQFLSAGHIGDDHDVANYMLAAKSSGGSVVIMLVKRSKRGLKIDVKSTDKKLAKAISSDLKKVSI
jgi:AP-3 complex subunit delta-1